MGAFVNFVAVTQKISVHRLVLKNYRPIRPRILLIGRVLDLKTNSTPRYMGTLAAVDKTVSACQVVQKSIFVPHWGHSSGWDVPIFIDSEYLDTNPSRTSELSCTPTACERINTLYNSDDYIML